MTLRGGGRCSGEGLPQPPTPRHWQQSPFAAATTAAGAGGVLARRGRGGVPQGVRGVGGGARGGRADAGRGAARAGAAGARRHGAGPASLLS